MSVVVGFLYILNLCLCSSFVMERSKKFMVSVSYTHLDVYKRQAFEVYNINIIELPLKNYYNKIVLYNS